MSTEHTLSEALETAQARIAELEDHLSAVLKLCDYANKGAFENGVKSECGLDEGDVIAGHIIDAARAALSSTPPVAVWPRVLTHIGVLTVLTGDAFDATYHAESGVRLRPALGTANLYLANGYVELHGEEKLAALRKCGLDANGKAIAKDGE